MNCSGLLVVTAEISIVFSRVICSDILSFRVWNISISVWGGGSVSTVVKSSSDSGSVCGNLPTLLLLTVMFTRAFLSGDLFVCGISLTSGQFFNELFQDCTRSCFSQVVLRRRGGDRIYEMRCIFVAVGPNACFIVLPHWDNMS